MDAQTRSGRSSRASWSNEALTVSRARAGRQPNRPRARAKQARLWLWAPVVLVGSATAQPVETLRVVGGLAGIHQFTVHEQPFWTRELPRLSGGRARAQIVAFDEAGLRGTEMLRLVQAGAVPFATMMLALVAGQDPELGAADLAGLNPDMASLRSHLQAFRPHLESRLREHWGIEPLAVYAYPAQVAFCSKPFASLADLGGRRIRSANTAQSDLVEALGAVPVQSAFGDIVPKLRKGDIECAITGTMSGNTIGLPEVTTHVHTMAANWGLAVFGANREAWQALSPELRALLRRELAKLEKAIWDDAERETGEGLACNSGSSLCLSGRKGRMTVVPEVPEDARKWREIFVSTVLPRWIQRCGVRCTTVWNETLGPVTGIRALPPRP